jgi:undecaprenyl-phosphate 4-deoxy-4-formamido-L-arabinose transferase
VPVDASPVSTAPEHTISIVVPVYSGEKHLAALTAEIELLTTTRSTPDGHRYRVAELILVHDCGRDDSARVMRDLADQHDWVRTIWLSRNFGQHPATVAGMASSSSEWTVTMDEDGQHDPADIAALLDSALRHQAALVYADPVNPAPHSAFRRVTSKGSKRVINLLGNGVDASVFHSFRLILGEIGRSVAAYVGQGVYLDVALNWVAGTPATAPVTLRDEGERASGYSARKLASHFWRMVLTSGTRGLRIVSVLGMVCALAGVILACWLVAVRLGGGNDVQGWTSLMVVTLLCAGAVLFSLGVVAEYIGVAVNMAMGKPLYLIISDPASGPLGRGDADGP